MGVRENKVENYMALRVKLTLNGITRAWKKSNVIGVMDQILFIPDLGREIFVEVKTVDGTREAPQIREAKKLRDHGALVTCVFGEAGVDKLIKQIVDHLNEYHGYLQCAPIELAEIYQ